MEKKCIKETIVVEGHDDSEHLKRFFDCITIETSGTGIRKETLQRIQKAQKTTGVVIFTDPDSAGNRIRNTINEKVTGCKNAYLLKKEARTLHKVGLEHASYQAINRALNHVVTYQEKRKETITNEVMLQLGLIGNEDSSKKRKQITNQLYVEASNAKALKKRLNEMGITVEKLKEILHV